MVLYMVLYLVDFVWQTGSAGEALVVHEPTPTAPTRKGDTDTRITSCLAKFLYGGSCGARTPLQSTDRSETHPVRGPAELTHPVRTSDPRPMVRGLPTPPSPPNLGSRPVAQAWENIECTRRETSLLRRRSPCRCDQREPPGDGFSHGAWTILTIHRNIHLAVWYPGPNGSHKAHILSYAHMIALSRENYAPAICAMPSNAFVFAQYIVPQADVGRTSWTKNLVKSVTPWRSHSRPSNDRPLLHPGLVPDSW